MGSQGGSAPNGLKGHELKTRFLRAPYQDWAALDQGYKTEFRALPMGVSVRSLQTPTPVVLYAVSNAGVKKQKLMVLTRHETQRLMDIADYPESLLREGFETYDHFRRYWRARTKRPFRPLEKVEAFQLRPWLRDDPIALGHLLVQRLYGSFIPE
jgi:hypothetical protein